MFCSIRPSSRGETAFAFDPFNRRYSLSDRRDDLAGNERILVVGIDRAQTMIAIGNDHLSYIGKPNK
jgi:hypothetical protein